MKRTRDRIQNFTNRTLAGIIIAGNYGDAINIDFGALNQSKVVDA